MSKFDEINFEEKLPNGEPRYRLLESGAVQDRSVWKIVAKTTTSEQAREMVNRRWDKWREANASAILKEAQAIDPTIKTEQEALAMAAGKTFVAILESDIPRGDDLVKLAQLAGAHPTAADVRDLRGGDSPVNIGINAEGLRLLMNLVSGDDILDGEVEDVE